jgi:hypothetical protein
LGVLSHALALEQQAFGFEHAHEVSDLNALETAEISERGDVERALLLVARQAAVGRTLVGRGKLGPGGQSIFFHR